jgi:hypothetical protein
MLSALVISRVGYLEQLQAGQRMVTPALLIVQSVSGEVH